MAKDKGSKKDKAKDEAPASEKAEKKTHKYGVSDLAEALGIKDASVRVQLRNKGIEKDGKSYGWDTKADFQEVVDQLKKAAKEEKEAAGEKPAKGKKGKAPAETDEERAAREKAEKKAAKKAAKEAKD